MAENRPGFVYLDIETSGLDSSSHEVIAAATQRMDARGPTEDKPKLLTAWAHGGEDGVLQSLLDLGLFLSDGPQAHDLIPVGSSLDFTLAFACDRLPARGLARPTQGESTRFLARKPRVDLKGALVLMTEALSKAQMSDVLPGAGSVGVST